MAGEPKWEVAPVLRVRNVRAAVDYYREKLGFECPDDTIYDEIGVEGGIYAFVRRGEIQIHLGRARTDQRIEPGTSPNAQGVYLYVPDCVSLYEEFKRRGANIIQRPEVAFYGMNEVVVLDLDGYVITFGSPPRTEETD